jgi:hypothetical protein
MSSIEQQINAIVAQASAAIDAIEAKALAAVNKLKSLQAVTEVAEAPVAEAAATTPVTEKKRKAGRQVKNLPLTIVGAPIYIKGKKGEDRSNGTIVEEDGVMKFRFDGVNHKSPTAATHAFCQRITVEHPEVTKEASGWSWVFFGDGDFKDKPISEFYDSLNAAAPAAEPPAAEVKVKAKKVLSPEHLAKLKAGREAAKAKKEAEKEAAKAEAALEEL